METMEQKNERNARVAERYDELMREGKHGHYETMFRVVREEVERERERCAKLCDDEARIRKEAGEQHPEESDSRGRCFAAARAAMNCARGVRSGEVV